MKKSISGKLCFHCGKEMEASEELIIHHIDSRGWGSVFDSMNFDIQVCPNCSNDLEIENEWFDNDICFNNESGAYINELYITNLIETFTEEAQDHIYQ